MAKRKKVRRKRAFFKTKSKRRKSNPTGNLLMTVAGAMIYGAGREYLSNLIQPVTSKLPFGGFEDEVALGVLGYFTAKGQIPIIGKNKIVKEVGKAMLVVEGARAGSAVFGMIAPQAPNSGGSLSATVF